jgi:hypothetical protein
MSAAALDSLRLPKKTIPGYIVPKMEVILDGQADVVQLVLF